MGMRDFLLFLIGVGLGMTVMLVALLHDFIKRVGKWW